MSFWFLHLFSSALPVVEAGVLICFAARREQNKFLIPEFAAGVLERIKKNYSHKKHKNTQKCNVSRHLCLSWEIRR